LHKVVCRPADERSKIPKIAQTILASTLLNVSLQACFITAFGLLCRSRTDIPFAARLDIAIEPTDFVDFVNIYEGRPAEKVKGMVQVNAFTPLDDTFIRDNELKLWRHGKDAATKPGPVGLLVVSKANAGTCIFQFTIHEEAFDFVRTDPRTPTISPRTGRDDEPPRPLWLHGVRPNLFRLIRCISFSG